MIQASGVIICLGYILGLLLTAIPWGGAWVLLVGIIAPLLLSRVYTQSAQKRETSLNKTQTKNKGIIHTKQPIPHPRVWVAAGLVGFLATVYFQFRVPQPEAKDISQFISEANNNTQEQLVIVRGKVESKPRLTRNQRGQFWLAVTQLGEVKQERDSASNSQGVTGKLYVTVPILQVTGLYPGQQIGVTGVLYKPQAASNPGTFDFKKYLQQEGTFAGLIGRQVNLVDEQYDWGWWQIRQRIVRSQVRGLGVPEGTLLSAMVIGSKAVDLPYDIRDLFSKVGLAHALAASGFQTSLILGIILQLTRKANKGLQIGLGSVALITFLSLTGFQPSVLRAVIMGFAALIALALGRRVQQLGSLLLAATILLLFNPIWIWNLGFQLSFLATLGLIVTASPITQRLDWLPPAIASLVAVPLAATIWTLPLLLHTFSVVGVYSLPLNIITTPLISVISIGGMITALVSLISPELGSYLASFLYYPTHWLIQLAEFFATLPGSSFAVGSISIFTMLTIYGLIGLTWLVGWWQKHWWVAGLIGIFLVVIPVWHTANNLSRITLLATGTEPVLVIQDRGNVTLINSGNEGSGRYTILPFLQQQGINQINWAIASKFPGEETDAWLEITQNLPIQNFYKYSSPTDNIAKIQLIQQKIQNHQGTYQPLTIGQIVTTRSTVAQLVNDQLPILRLQIFGQNWLLVGNITSQQIAQLIKTGDLSRPQVLWCLPESLKDLVLALEPQIAITSAGDIDQNTLSEINKKQIKLFFTGRDGAIQWTPKDNFQPFIQSTENKSSVF
ncbi:ComEC/Rec2 family competence protein [Cronbergia sp. UHCC 0137]|uniref:ComEC/Rec2 family competence protein n=1 Tax=Cronbergia sp. UHCC 0137 TaxID=3110239 RepID=UPI002B20D564|nr:ComEC/Rec2 family competence protein [Cronbergia sp. UHCC 0137]MEA5619556.1 ComEC/Rec2 family competence protein [Cronbergia sp. UHCC 0137]